MKITSIIDPMITKSGSIDTLLISKLLKQASFSEPQAEIIAELFKQNRDSEEELEQKINSQNLATKEDLQLEIRKIESEIKRLDLEIQKVKSDLVIEIKRVESDLIKEIKRVEFDLTKEIKRVERDLLIEIKRVEANLTLEIHKVEAKLTIEIEKIRTEVEKSKVDIIKWVAGLMLAQTGLLFTLIKFFA